MSEEERGEETSGSLEIIRLQHLHKVSLVTVSSVPAQLDRFICTFHLTVLAASKST